MQRADIEWPRLGNGLPDKRVRIEHDDLVALQAHWNEVVRLVTQAKYALTGNSNPEHVAKGAQHALRLLEEAGF